MASTRTRTRTRTLRNRTKRKTPEKGKERGEPRPVSERCQKKNIMKGRKERAMCVCVCMCMYEIGWDGMGREEMQKGINMPKEMVRLDCVLVAG